MTHNYLVALKSLADSTVGMGWAGTNNCHATWSACIWVPILATPVQY